MFVIPFGTAIWLSFHNWDYIQRPVFVNTRNFDKLLGDPGFWNALWTTVRFSAVEIFVALSLALLLALALSHLRPVYQYTLLAIYNLPVIMPGVVSVLLWKWLYRTNGGAFNAILESFGLPQQPFSKSPDQALWCITLMVVWIFLGNSSIVLLAAINEVPDSLLEAAQLDGASAWKRFTAVTLPLIQPAMAYQVVTSIIGTMQMFEPLPAHARGPATAPVRSRSTPTNSASKCSTSATRRRLHRHVRHPAQRHSFRAPAPPPVLGLLTEKHHDRHHHRPCPPLDPLLAAHTLADLAAHRRPRRRRRRDALPFRLARALRLQAARRHHPHPPHALARRVVARSLPGRPLPQDRRRQPRPLLPQQHFVTITTVIAVLITSTLGATASPACASPCASPSSTSSSPPPWCPSSPFSSPSTSLWTASSSSTRSGS